MTTSPTHRLLQITDTHLLGSKETLLRGVPTYATLRAVISHAQQRFADADGILLTGDLVHDDAAGYPLIREAFAETRLPVYCIPGNHDVPEAMFSTLRSAPFVLDDHVLLDHWLVVLINSWQANRADGRVGTHQLQRLETLLSQHPDRHALICLHHHPIAMHSGWLDQVGLQDADAFRACIAAHKQVRGVLWGHVHQSLDQLIKGVRYMATPSTCSQFLPSSNEFVLDNRPPGYRTLELNPDGSINTEVVWLSERAAAATLTAVGTG